MAQSGVKRATGEYIFFWDSYDWLLPNRLVEVIERVGSEDVVYFNATRYFEEIQKYDPVCKIDEYDYIQGIEYFNNVVDRKRNMPFVCVWGGFYKRSFLLENRLYNEPSIYHEDSYFTPQVLLKAQYVSAVNVTLYVYRIRKGSITSSVKCKHIQDMLFICRSLYKIFEETANVSQSFYQYISSHYINNTIRSL